MSLVLMTCTVMVLPLFGAPATADDRHNAPSNVIHVLVRMSFLLHVPYAVPIRGGRRLLEQLAAFHVGFRGPVVVLAGDFLEDGPRLGEAARAVEREPLAEAGGGNQARRVGLTLARQQLEHADRLLLALHRDVVEL